VLEDLLREVGAHTRTVRPGPPLFDETLPASQDPFK
jgi:hypothetical protein